MNNIIPRNSRKAFSLNVPETYASQPGFQVNHPNIDVLRETSPLAFSIYYYIHWHEKVEEQYIFKTFCDYHNESYMDVGDAIVELLCCEWIKEVQ